MNKTPVITSIVILIGAGILKGDDKPGLSPQWRKWLDEDVVYIISPKEREVFLSLTTDHEREGFERAFWLQRDPSYGTEANEFKEEHYRKLKDVEKNYGRGGKPGWQTDRGRIYIILGKPADIERFRGEVRDLAPSELWFYNGSAGFGLPSFFYILFYEDVSSGEYKLYSPSFDGPQRLLQRNIEATLSRYEAYQMIKEISPELAGASLSLIPGSEGDPMSNTSSLSSDLLLSTIQTLSQKKIQSQWAEAFLNNRAIVMTDYSVNYVKSQSCFFVHQVNKKNYLHAVIEPQRLTMNEGEQKISAPLKLNVQIKEPTGKIIHQEEKNIDLELNAENRHKIEKRVVALGDLIPVVEGHYSVNVLLRNTSSKEFSSEEAAIVSPAAGLPSLSPLLLAYDEKAVPENAPTVPFALGGHQFYPNSQRIYAKNERLIFFCEVYNPSAELKDWTLNTTISRDEKIVAQQTDKIGVQACVLSQFPLSSYAPGYYRIKAVLRDTRQTDISSREEEFSLSTSEWIPRPWNYNRVYPPLEHPYFSIIRAYQYLELGKNDDVIEQIRSTSLQPGSLPQISLLLATAFFNKGQNEEVVRLLTPLADSRNNDILILLGRACAQLQDYHPAMGWFEKALEAGGEIVDVLNALGYCCLKTGDVSKARTTFERSLRANPHQTNIAELLQNLSKKREETR